MNFKPILFSTEMIRAILDGRKTETRRILKPQPGINAEFCRYDVIGQPLFTDNTSVPAKYKKGDGLWVRETWTDWNDTHPEGHYAYKADFQQRYGAWERDTPNGFADIERVEAWKPSIFMPKAACRIFLQTADIRVERIQDIMEADALAEGVSVGAYPNDLPVLSYAGLWIEINGEGSWNSNPWVWVINFSRIDKPDNF